MWIVVTEGRRWELDALRGLAVVVMILDHILHLTVPESPLRLLTRIAMPVFALLAGHLAQNYRPGRWLGLAAVGLVIGALVPWIDSPNILVWLGLGMYTSYWARERPWLGVAVVVGALTVMANRYPYFQFGNGFDALAVVALCVAGALTPQSAFAEAGRVLPRQVAVVGRLALPVYVVHVALFSLFWGLA